MAFARTTAVAGAGTVSCTGTTTVTGVGTTFATATGAAAASTSARIGGTITVAGVTKTIVAIQSTTSLTTDTAFGTFTGSAFTVQTGINQTGTDALNLSVGSATGITITNRADLYRTFDVQGNDLFIAGTVTVDSTIAQLRNDGSCNNAITITGSASGGELIINGRKSVANDGPFPYAGFDWLGTNGLKIMRLDSTNATYPAKFTVIDACVRYGADWITTYANNFSRITTQGTECWILCGKGTGTNQARLRQDNTTASIDFQATKTWVGVWLNFGVPQISLKGYTPIYTDGPEINLGSVSVATQITIENYNTTYVTPAYYAGVQFVMLGGAWVRLKNNLVGTNIAWRAASASGRNVLEFSKQVKATAKDAAGNLLSDGYFYFTPTGSNVAGIRGKGMSTDITFDLSKKTLLLTSGVAETEFPFAWDYRSIDGNYSQYQYFCSGQTKGAETHPAFVSLYGYDTQPITMALSGNGTFEATTVHASLPTTNKVIANAAAISGVTVNFDIKTLTITGSVTIQQIYDYYQYQRNLTANLGVGDDCVIAGSQTRYVGWTIQVNPTGTIASSSAFTSIYADYITIVNSATMPYLFNSGGVLQSAGVLLTTTILGVQDTYTGTGSITAIYANSTGTSMIWTAQGILATSPVCVWDASGNTIQFWDQTTPAGNRNLYIAPGINTTYSFGVRKYGYKPQYGTFATNYGGQLYFVPTYLEDVGISQPSQSVVEAYTAVENDDKWFDSYAVAALGEQIIKLGDIVQRDGVKVAVSSPYSGKVKVSNASNISVLGNTIFCKAPSFSNGVKFTVMKMLGATATFTADTTEVIDADIEDANGDSALSIYGGSGNFSLWKVTNATLDADWATGVSLGSVSNGKYRYIHADGYKIVVHDLNSNINNNASMTQGVYDVGMYYGSQIQLAQNQTVTLIDTKVDIMQNDLNAIKGTGFVKDTDSLTNVRDYALTAAKNTQT